MVTVVAIVLLAAVLIALVGVATRGRRPGEAGAPAAAPATVARPADPVARLVEGLRTRRWARYGLSTLSLGLLVGAAIMLGYPFYTNLYQSRVQAQLDRQLASPELQQAYQQGRIGEGDSLTRIRIPAINVDTIVVSGISDSALRAGAGHYPMTPLPCEPGNVAIAGHRTTYGRPFHNLDLLRPGDTIILETPVGSCTYEVDRAPFVVQPDALHVIDPTPHGELTLTTCHPKHSAAQRLIVKARLVSGGAAQA